MERIPSANLLTEYREHATRVPLGAHHLASAYQIFSEDFPTS
jgi:hypothetical protein